MKRIGTEIRFPKNNFVIDDDPVKAAIGNRIWHLVALLGLMNKLTRGYDLTSVLTHVRKKAHNLGLREIGRQIQMIQDENDPHMGYSVETLIKSRRLPAELEELEQAVRREIKTLKSHYPMFSPIGQ